MTICNPLGLHVRASSRLVACAQRFISDIRLVYGDQHIDAKRILSVMSSGLRLGDQVVVEVDGEDSERAMAAVVQLVESGFGEVSPK